MTTLAERLTRTGEAILDLAAALPDDLRVVSIHSDGYHYTDRLDAAVHLALFRDALRTVADLGGVWVHTLSPHEPGANAVHHQWRGTFHGWAVQITAIWMASELPPVVPMVEQLPPVTSHWERDDDRARKARELAEHPELAERLDGAIDAVHRLELAGAW